MKKRGPGRDRAVKTLKRTSDFRQQLRFRNRQQFLQLRPHLVGAGLARKIGHHLAHHVLVAGLPMSVYFDNIVLTQTPEQYRFEVRGMEGQSEARRWTVTPTDKDVGDHRLDVIVKDSTGKELERAQTTLHISRRDAGSGKPLRLLIVGDSLTNATLYPNETFHQAHFI